MAESMSPTLSRQRRLPVSTGETQRRQTPSRWQPQVPGLPAIPCAIAKAQGILIAGRATTIVRPPLLSKNSGRFCRPLTSKPAHVSGASIAFSFATPAVSSIDRVLVFLAESSYIMRLDAWSQQARFKSIGISGRAVGFLLSRASQPLFCFQNFNSSRSSSTALSLPLTVPQFFGV